MTDKRPEDKVFRFDSPGTLLRPRLIGRVVRLVLGLYLVYSVYLVFAYIGPTRFSDVNVLIWLAVTIWLTPYVVNIGWGRHWGMWPRLALLGLWAAAVLLNLTLEGALLGPVSWPVIKWTSLYVMGHLGLSFVLAAVIATPGCEMRAIPHLVGLVSQRPSAEHYCPGFLDRLDRWERVRSSRQSNDVDR